MCSGTEHRGRFASDNTLLCKNITRVRLKKLNFDIICWNCRVSVETITIYGWAVKEGFKGSLTVVT